jgi:hypothetical protein
LLLLTLLTSESKGADAWFLRMNALGAPIDPSGCTQSYWTDDVLFFNNSATNARVKFLDATYPLSADGIDVKAGHSATLHEQLGTAQDPSAATRLGVLHVDIPADVVTMSRMLLFAQQAFPKPPACPVLAPPFYGPSAYSTVPLPVRTSLAPANLPQVHLGADLAGIESRLSVVVYNASRIPATAQVVLRRGCDDGVLAEQNVSVPANGVVQVFGLSTADDHACAQGNPAGLRRTVTVTVDQPSLSFVTATQQFSLGAPLLGASIVY